VTACGRVPLPRRAPAEQIAAGECMRATADEGREVARAALWFGVRWAGMVALALAAAAVIAAVS
jgi:hypothetical protein